MSQQELVALVIGVLNRAGIDYMVTGSWASTIHGEPRLTHDIDLVVSITPTQVPALLQAFTSPDFYLSQQAIEDALRNKTMFNLVSLQDAEKVDFWILSDDPFYQSSFARKRLEDFDGILLQVSSPEDTILAKLRWAELSGGSEKQFRDAIRVYEVQLPRLDIAYLNQWAANIGVDSLWQRIQTEARVP